MKINIKKLIILSAMTIIIMIASISITINANPNSSPNTTKKPPLYTAKAYNGQIAIFKHGLTSPVKILDIYISNLPQKDRELLYTGIDIANDSELIQFYEDFDQ